MPLPEALQQFIDPRTGKLDPSLLPAKGIEVELQDGRIIDLTPNEGSNPGKPFQKQHPGLSFTDRLKVQNLATNPRVAADWLQRERGFEVGQTSGGRLSIRKPGEKEWHVVDPKGFDWQDITDLGDDIPLADIPALLTDATELAQGSDITTSQTDSL